MRSAITYPLYPLSPITYPLVKNILKTGDSYLKKGRAENKKLIFDLYLRSKVTYEVIVDSRRRYCAHGISQNLFIPS